MSTWPKLSRILKRSCWLDTFQKKAGIDLFRKEARQGTVQRKDYQVKVFDTVTTKMHRLTKMSGKIIIRKTLMTLISHPSSLTIELTGSISSPGTRKWT